MKVLKYSIIVVLALVGAAFFYITGLGTGLYIAQPSTQVAAATATLPVATPTHMATPPAPTATLTPVPTLPATATPTPIPSPTAVQESDFGVFWEAWDLLQNQFYGELPSATDLPYAAIEGVIARTGDQYTAFLDPVRADILSQDMTGSFEGIGATVRLRDDGKLEIVQPLPGQPASQEDLRPGDVILEADGVALQGKNIYEAISLIRGPAGTVVRLLVERQDVDQPFVVEVTRARIEMPVVESEMLEENIAYVRLNGFGETATDELQQALLEQLAKEPEALIFDLRGNPGGYLSTAVKVASQFIGEGTILVERFRDDTERTYSATRGGVALDVPLVVLVDGGTASASEIVAGAIQDADRGTLIGTQTLGKGSVQLVNTLSDGSQLRVTTARWFTPDGRAIHGTGLEPDILVEITDQDITSDRDPQLERAIAYLQENQP
jgi:carboxyl-terminal processing protease